MGSIRIIGMGRVGTALAAALHNVGWTLADPIGHHDDPTHAGSGVDLVAITTPDFAIASVAQQVEAGGAVMAHFSGALGLDVLAPHGRRMSVHPLVSIPHGPLGRQRLTAGARFAVAGDPLATQLVESLGGTAFVVDDAHRADYHAAACIASNHLVALLGQVERVAGKAGLPLATFLDLVRGTIDSVERLGPRAALTGPAARGDTETLARHLAVLADSDRPSYEAMAELARRLAESEGPADPCR